MRNAMLCLSLSALVLSAMCAGENPRLFGSSVGLNVKYSQGEPMADLPLLKELGVRWVRDHVSWPTLEPAAGDYKDFPAAFQERLKFYKENDIGVLFILAYDNAKAYPDTKEQKNRSVDSDAFAKFAVHAAKLLKASGVRFVLEIWNEPHNFVLKKKLGGEWNGKPPSPWLDHYVEMVRACVKAVKAFDPAVMLIDCDDMWILHYRFVEKGLPAELDGFGIHPYSGQSAGPEITPVGQETSWARPFVLTDADRSLASAARRLRAYAVEKMGKSPPLWATEWGWSIGEKAPFSTLTPDAHVTENTVAAYLPRAFISAFAAGIETTFWFSSFDSVNGPMGLRAHGGKKRKAFEAFKTLTHELNAYALVKHALGSDHLNAGLQAFVFQGPQGHKVALWNIDGTVSVSIPVTDGAAVKCVDVLGKDVPVKIENGRVKLAVSQAPIYVTGLPDDFAGKLSLDVPEGTAPKFLFP